MLKEQTVSYTEHVVQRGAFHLYAREYPGEEPTMLIMHGFPDNVHLYDRLVPWLSPSRRVVIFDFLGWGASEKHAQFSEPELGAEFEAYNAFTAEVQQKGVLLSGEALMPVNTATTVRVRDGKPQRSRLAAACSILQRGRPVGGNGQESQQAGGPREGEWPKPFSCASLTPRCHGA